MQQKRETFDIEPEMIQDDFIKKNFGPVPTEDLVGGDAIDKENLKKKGLSASKKKKRKTKEEIAESNQKIGSFFSAKRNGKRSKKKEVIDLERAEKKKKIIEEVVDPIEPKIKIKEEVKKPETKKDSYKPPKLKILEKPTILPATKPKTKGCLKLPKISEFPWKDKLFVISGKLHTTEDRKEMNEFLSFWGMIPRTSISKKTDILIHGHILDDGRNYHQSGKYKKAKRFNTEILSEEQVDALFLDFTGFSLEQNFSKWNEQVDDYPKNLIEEIGNAGEEAMELDNDEIDLIVGKNNFLIYFT